MPRLKRDLPAILHDADRKVEEWRASLLRDLPRRTDVAAYHLLAVAGARLAYLSRQLMPHAAATLHTATRDQLFGLQFALAGLPLPGSADVFAQHLIDGAITEADFRLAAHVIDEMSRYAVVRDVFLTYGWRGYELEVPGEGILRFVNPPDWPGLRDYAEQILAQEIEAERAVALLPRVAGLPIAALEAAVDVPGDLPMGDLTAEQFVRTRFRLTASMAEKWWTGETLIIEYRSLATHLQRLANLSEREAERFIELVTFAPGDSRLTLFHCPIVQLTTKSVALCLPGLVFGNPSAAIPRLTALRGPGLGAFSKRVEADLLERLKTQFGGATVTIQINVSYTHGDDRGDLDLIAYEQRTNDLLVAQVKAFITPDTVEEIVRANQELEEGLGQIARARNWISGLGPKDFRERLRIPIVGTAPRIRYAVIGNGFAGSDYLPIGPDVPVVDARFLLLPRFRGGSVVGTIEAYQRRLEIAIREVGDLERYRGLVLGPIRVEVPARQIVV